VSDPAEVPCSYSEPAVQEIEIGKLLIDAAVAGGAKRIVWSGLPSIDKLTNGRFKNVHHWECEKNST